MANDQEILEQIEAVLDRDIRPVLALHGGNIRSLSCEDGVYRFQLTGQCSGCPSADLTSEELVRGTLLEALPQLRDAVLTSNVSEELLEQARAILRGELR